MIKYHGSPISGSQQDQLKFYKNRHALISYASKSPRQNLITESCQSFCVDNGAYSVWKKGSVLDWGEFYDWLQIWLTHPKFDFFFIPDDIGGDKNSNNKLVASCRLKFSQRHLCCPVFHLGEDLDRFTFFKELGYTRVALGSTPDFELRTPKFWEEMRNIFDFITDSTGVPLFKVHGLRMLRSSIIQEFPFSSGDSSTAGIKSAFDYIWEDYPFAPLSKSGRANLVADKLELSQSPSFYKPLNQQGST